MSRSVFVCLSASTSCLHSAALLWLNEDFNNLGHYFKTETSFFIQESNLWLFGGLCDKTMSLSLNKDRNLPIQII